VARQWLFRSRAALQTEVLTLRHQLNVLRRRAPKRVAVSDIDRLVLAGRYHLAPEVLGAVKILKPETIIRWHRVGCEPGGGGNQGRAAVDNSVAVMFDFVNPVGADRSVAALRRRRELPETLEIGGFRRRRNSETAGWLPGPNSAEPWLCNCCPARPLYCD
jgi:hypothetical protein